MNSGFTLKGEEKKRKGKENFICAYNDINFGNAAEMDVFINDCLGKWKVSEWGI